MRTVHRTQTTIGHELHIKLKQYSKVLSVAPARDSNDKIDVWYIANDNTSLKDITATVHVFGTGHPIDNGAWLTFIGTCVMPNGLVWHVFADYEVDPLAP